MSSAKWSEVLTDFDPDEETANFGTRHALELEGNIFEVSTLATIDPVGSVTRNPTITSLTVADKVFLAIDSTIVVLSLDGQEAEPFEFSDVVETFAVSECGRFILAGESNGSIQLFHVTTKRMMISLTLVEADADNGADNAKTFLCASFLQIKDCDNMFLISSSGEVFMFSNLSLETLDAALREGQLSTLKQLQANIQRSSFSLEFNCQLYDCCCLPGMSENSSSLCISSEQGLSFVTLRLNSTDTETVFSVAELDTFVFGQVPIVKVVFSQNSQRMHCLDAHGLIHDVCPFMVMLVRTFQQEYVVDFALIENESSSHEVHAMLITRDPGHMGETSLMIQSLLDGKILYCLKVSSFSTLVNPMKSQDVLMMMEGVVDAHGSGHASRLRLRGITEGVPEARLTRMLRRNKFKESEEFAGLYGLSKQPVFKAKIAWLLTQLSPWQEKCSMAEKETYFEEFKEYLSKVTDIDHIIESCILAPLPNIQMTRELLLYARSCIRKSSTVQALDESHLLAVGKTLHLLETFQTAYPTGSVNDWIQFSRGRMLSKIRSEIKNGNVTIALLFWVRHKEEFMETLDLDMVASILSDLSAANISISDQMHWLRQFIPDILCTVADSLPKIAEWSVGAVKRLEFQSKEWPRNGLELAQDILNTLQFNNKGQSYASGNKIYSEFMTILTLTQQRADPDSPLCSLIGIIKDLKDLICLHGKFNMKLKLSEFQQEDKFSVISLILDWITMAEEVPDVMDNFLIGYVNECGLDMNKTLTNYIINLLHNTNYTWHWHIGPAPWEEKVDLLLNYISSIELKSVVILEIVKQATVPWSPTILKISKAGCDLQHPNAMKISQQQSLMSLKEILRKYGCRSYDTVGRGADRLLQYMMHNKGNEGFEDALKAGRLIGNKSAVDIKKLYLDHIIEVEQDTAKAIGVLGAGKDEEINEEKKELFQYVLDKAILACKMGLSQTVTVIYVEAVKSILLNVKSLASRKAESQSTFLQRIVEQGSPLLRSYALDREFGIKTQETDFYCQYDSILDTNSVKKQVFSYISEQVKERMVSQPSADSADQSSAADENPKATNLADFYFKVLRLCDLTEVSHEEGVGQLMLELTKTGLFDQAIEVGGMLGDSEVKSELAHVLYSVVHRMQNNIANASDLGGLPQYLAKFASQAVSCCSDSSLVDCMELYNWQFLSNRIIKESHDRNLFASSSKENQFREGRLAKIYKDKGFPLEKETLLPELVKALEAVLPLEEGEPLPYLPNSLAFSNKVADFTVSVLDEDDCAKIRNGTEVSESVSAMLGEMIGVLQRSAHSQLAYQALLMGEFCLSGALQVVDPNLKAKICNQFLQLRFNLVSQILPRILSENRPDPGLGLSFILTESKKGVFNLLAKLNAKFGFDYKKISYLALVGMKFCELNLLTKQKDQFKDLYIRACWGHKISGMDIEFKDAFRDGKTKFLDVLKVMVSHQDVDIDLLLKYSKAFEIDTDETLILYVAALFRKLEPQVVANEKPEGQSFDGMEDDGFTLVPNPDKSKIVSQIQSALKLVSYDSWQYDFLMKEFQTINPYNYEGIEMILSSISQTQTYRDADPTQIHTAKQVLRFLLQYKRISEPHPEEEIDRWMKERSSPFPTLAKYRLPLYGLVMLPSKAKTKLLEKEFSLETYESWILVSNSLGISLNSICMFSVSNAISSMLEKTAKHEKKKDENWIISHVNKAILDQVQECISRIPDREKATAATNFVFNRLPKGADKVLAAENLVRVAEEWHVLDSASQESQRGLQMARKSRNQLQTEQVLYKYGLAKPEYLKLVNQSEPTDLILKLYEDPSIVERTRVAAGWYPDILGAAKSIAEINSLNHTQIKYSLLDKWLTTDGNGQGSANPDDTFTDFTLDVRNLKEEKTSTESDNLIHCIYLLQDDSESIRYLQKHATINDPSATNNYTVRVLQCLLSIASESEVEELLGREIHVVRQTLKDLIFLSRMEALYLPCTLEAFQTRNKDSLVEGIWRLCKNTPEGISLVRDLCVEYCIWDHQLWTSLLEQMQRYSLFSELEQTLIMLNSQPQLWTSSEFVPAWNFLLASPFTSLLPPVPEDKEEKCRNMLKLVHFCPVAFDLNLVDIVEDCLRLELSHLAAVLLPYLPKDVRTGVEEKLENQISEEDLNKKLKELENQGFPPLVKMEAGRRKTKLEYEKNGKTTVAPAL